MILPDNIDKSSAIREKFDKPDIFATKSSLNNLADKVKTIAISNKFSKHQFTKIKQDIPNMEFKKEVDVTSKIKEELLKLEDDINKIAKIEKEIAMKKTDVLPNPKVIKPGSPEYKFLQNNCPHLFHGLNEEDEIRILWRGCRPDQFVKMLINQSAGPMPYNPNTTAPSEEQAKKQVGESSESLPEFTENTTVASSFARGGNIVGAFAIPTRYLTLGSVVEKGWVSQKDAPVALLNWKEGQPHPHMATASTQGRRFVAKRLILD